MIPPTFMRDIFFPISVSSFRNAVTSVTLGHKSYPCNDLQCDGRPFNPSHSRHIRHTSAICRKHFLLIVVYALFQVARCRSMPHVVRAWSAALLVLPFPSRPSIHEDPMPLNPVLFELLRH